MRISDWSSDVCSSDLIAATMERVRALTEEKKILQDIFGDQSDPTAEMRKGFEDLRNTIVDVSSTWGRAAATMVSGAENIAKANRFAGEPRSEEHTSELQSLMRISYAVFCLKKKNK